MCWHFKAAIEVASPNTVTVTAIEADRNINRGGISCSTSTLGISPLCIMRGLLRT